MSNTTNSPKPTVTKGVVGENNAATQTNTHGKTVIDNGVVAKIAGIAAREVRGVHALGGGAARAFGAIRDAIGSSDLSQGIRVEVGETAVEAGPPIVLPGKRHERPLTGNHRHDRPRRHRIAVPRRDHVVVPPQERLQRHPRRLGVRFHVDEKREWRTTGVLLATPFSGLPLILCGVLKITYDVALLISFRHVKPPEEQRD